MRQDQYPRAVTPRHTTGMEYVVVPFVVYGIIILYTLRPAGEIVAWISGDATYTGTLNLTAIGHSWTPPLPTGFVWAVAATMVTLGLIPIGILWYRLRRPRTPRAVRWATSGDLKKRGLIGPDEKGRVVAGTTRGRTVTLPPTTSTLVFGPSGSGKTSAFAIPTILTWDGPAVISAVKTDLLRATRHHRAQEGEIMVFDPFNRLEDPDRTGWDPLQHCDTYEGATTLAGNLLALSDFTTVSHGDFWAAAAEGLLGPLFLAARTGGHSLRQVRSWLNLTEWKEPKALLEGFFPEAWETLLGATENTATDTYLSYVASARVALKAYETAAALESTTLKPQVDLDQLLDTSSTLYLIGDEDDQKILRPLFVGLLDEAMRHAARRVNRGIRADRPLLFLLDDAANSAPLPRAPEHAATCRDRDVQLVSMYQDWSQVTDRYGELAQSLANNHTAKLVLSGSSDVRSLETISKLLGNERVNTVSTGGGRHGPHITEAETFEPLATVDELRRIPRDQAVLVYANVRPARIRLRPYYAQHRWKHLRNHWQPAGSIRSPQ